MFFIHVPVRKSFSLPRYMFRQCTYMYIHVAKGYTGYMSYTNQQAKMALGQLFLRSRIASDMYTENCWKTGCIYVTAFLRVIDSNSTSGVFVELLPES